MVRITGDRAIVSRHGPQASDGSGAGPLGRVPDAVTIEQACESARLTGLSILADLERALGDLDRIAAWGRVFGMVSLPFRIPVEIECEVVITF
jgi:hypothetical protein